MKYKLTTLVTLAALLSSAADAAALETNLDDMRLGVELSPRKLELSHVWSPETTSAASATYWLGASVDWKVSSAAARAGVAHDVIGGGDASYVMRLQLEGAVPVYLLSETRAGLSAELAMVNMFDNERLDWTFGPRFRAAIVPRESETRVEFGGFFGASFDVATRHRLGLVLSAGQARGGAGAGALFATANLTYARLQR